MTPSTENREQLVREFQETSRKLSALEEAAEAAQESARRLRASGFFVRAYVNVTTRLWSTVVWFCFRCGMRGLGIAAGRKVLQPPMLYPELRE
jgi:hypothetical protein